MYKVYKKLIEQNINIEDAKRIHFLNKKAKLCNVLSLGLKNLLSEIEEYNNYFKLRDIENHGSEPQDFFGLIEYGRLSDDFTVWDEESEEVDVDGTVDKARDYISEVHDHTKEAIDELNDIKDLCYTKKEDFLSKIKPSKFIHKISESKWEYFYFYKIGSVSFHKPVKDNYEEIEEKGKDYLLVNNIKYLVKEIELPPDNWDTNPKQTKKLISELKSEVNFDKYIDIDKILQSYYAVQEHYKDKKQDWLEREPNV